MQKHIQSLSPENQSQEKYSENNFYMVLGIGKKDLSLFIYSNFFKQVPRSIRRILIDICTLLMIVNSYVRFQIMDDYLLIVSCKYIITYHKYLKNAIIPGYTQFMCLYIGMYIYQVFLQLLQRFIAPGLYY